jgi:hypothetical protein
MGEAEEKDKLLKMIDDISESLKDAVEELQLARGFLTRGKVKMAWLRVYSAWKLADEAASWMRSELEAEGFEVGEYD